MEENTDNKANTTDVKSILKGLSIDELISIQKIAKEKQKEIVLEGEVDKKKEMEEFIDTFSKTYNVYPDDFPIFEKVPVYALAINEDTQKAEKENTGYYGIRFVNKKPNRYIGIAGNVHKLYQLKDVYYSFFKEFSSLYPDFEIPSKPNINLKGRMKQVINIPELEYNEKGRPIKCGLMFTNSPVGTSLRVDGYFYRVMCSNGMIVSHGKFLKMTQKHTTNFNTESIANNISIIIDSMKHFQNQIPIAINTTLTDDMIDRTKVMLGKRWKNYIDKIIKEEYCDNAKQDVKTVWDLHNIITWHSSHPAESNVISLRSRTGETETEISDQAFEKYSNIAYKVVMEIPKQ